MKPGMINLNAQGDEQRGSIRPLKRHYMRMKKLMMIATAAFFFSGFVFAHDGDKGKGKDKGKKTSVKSCPGKHCGKKS